MEPNPQSIKYRGVKLKKIDKKDKKNNEKKTQVNLG